MNNSNNNDNNNRRILILEPSDTLQKIIEKELSARPDWTVEFSKTGLQFIAAICANIPDLILLNANAQNPRSMEVFWLIKTMEKFNGLPSCIYATSNFASESFFSKLCRVDRFVNYREGELLKAAQEILEPSGEKKAPVKAAQNDVLKNAMVYNVFDTVHNLESIDKIVGQVLTLVSEFCELPAASMFLSENDGSYSYYISASNFSPADLKDFLNVSAADFNKYIKDRNLVSKKRVHLKSSVDLSVFRTEDLPLSSYKSLVLSDSRGAKFGTLHVVKEGNITAQQADMLQFTADLACKILEKALIVKEKLFFEKRIRKAFSRFVPEQIIDQLVEEADDSEKIAVGEKRKVAILFSDIRSFTNISECNKPEVIVSFLNRYFTTMVNVIKKHGGTIDKFIGDAIMALFGAPISYDDNAYRAVAAANEMREALQTVPLGDLVMPEGLKFGIGIGIHYGDVTVGSIGSSDKTDYTVIGDNVNLASRLEGLTKTYGTMIAVSDSVKKDIKTDDFVFRHLDDVKVKGKENAVSIYSVDKSIDEFPMEYRDSYKKGLELYQTGIWNLAKEYFSKAMAAAPNDKAAKLMISRCEEFIANPPENWDGATKFTTK